MCKLRRLWFSEWLPCMLARIYTFVAHVKKVRWIHVWQQKPRRYPIEYDTLHYTYSVCTLYEVNIMPIQHFGQRRCAVHTAHCTHCTCNLHRRNTSSFFFVSRMAEGGHILQCIRLSATKLLAKKSHKTSSQNVIKSTLWLGLAVIFFHEEFLFFFSFLLLFQNDGSFFSDIFSSLQQRIVGRWSNTQTYWRWHYCASNLHVPKYSKWKKTT